MFEWPETILPLPSHDFGSSVEYANIRSGMDSGRARQRPRFTQALELSSVVFELDRDGLAYFRAVFEHKLNNGTDWFLMRMPRPNKESLTLSEVRFASDLSESHRSFENWDISATIEYRDPDTISEDDLNEALLPAAPDNSLSFDGENLYFELHYITYN